MTHAGRWCDVFEIRDFKIQRLFIYLDPDYGSEDTERYPGYRSRPSTSASLEAPDSTTTPSTRRCATTSLLFLVTLEREGPRRLEALPLKLDGCYTRLAEGDDAAWIRRRFRAASTESTNPAAATDARCLRADGRGRRAKVSSVRSEAATSHEILWIAPTGAPRATSPVRLTPCGIEREPPP